VTLLAGLLTVAIPIILTYSPLVLTDFGEVGIEPEKFECSERMKFDCGMPRVNLRTVLLFVFYFRLAQAAPKEVPKF